jgi:hypothetical protein
MLSVLGKGLERLIARRLAWVATQEKILHPQHFGALPGRSATDLTAAAVHDIEETLLCSKVASMISRVPSTQCSQDGSYTDYSSKAGLQI